MESVMDDPERPPQSDPAAAIAALKAQGAPDEAIHAYLTQHLGLQEVSDPMAKYHRAYQTGRLQKNTAEKNEADKVSLLGGTVDAAVEAPETFAAGVPGAKLLISGGRKLLRPGQTFAQNQRDVNAETSDVPYASAIGRAAGSLATIPVLPANAVGAGAILGGADQLLNNDPDSGVGNRLLRTGAGAAGGAAIGKAADMVGTGFRALRATPLGERALQLGAKIKDAAKENYGRAAEEGRAFYDQFRQGANQVDETLARVEGAPKALPAPGQSHVAKSDLAQRRYQANYVEGAPTPTLEQAAKADYTNVLPETVPFEGPSITDPTNLLVRDYTKPTPVKLRAANDVNVRIPEASPASSPRPPNDYDTAMEVRDVLSRKDIAPYVDEVRGVREFANADDATVLRETYKLMSERQGLLKNRMANAGEFKAGTSLEGKELSDAKKALLDAADKIMPSFRGAVQEHARLSGERSAFRAGADATRRAANRSPVAGKKLETNTTEGFLESLKKMTPAEAQEAVQGILGRTGENIGLTANPFSGFGTVSSLLRTNRSAPLLRAADAAAGNTGQRTAQNAFLAALNGLTGAP